LVGVPMRRVIRVVQNQRDARYSMLRGYFHGADDDSVDEMRHERLATFTLPLGAKSIGKPLGHLALHALGVKVVNLRRNNGKTILAQEDTQLEDGDTLVLSGIPENLSIAEQKLLQSQ